MGNFITAYRITKENEGGYHDGGGINSADRGGETFKGIARNLHPTWEGWRDVDNLKKRPGFPNTALNDPAISQKVLFFYKKEFWDVNKLDRIHNQAICNEMFDTGVNMGVRTAAKFLQQSINVMNRNQKNFKNISEDGIIGDMTLVTINSLPMKDQHHIFDLMNILQGERYLEIIRKDESQEEFIRGWLNRIALMRQP